MSPKEIFEEKAPKALSKHADKMKKVGAVFKFDISGPEGGVWTMDLKADPPTVGAGDGAKPDCTITVAQDDFDKLMGNFAVAMQLFATGKLKVDNPMVAMKLQKVLPYLKV
ncbi:MAG: SCP2 sterol-binding domain-containing protein [Deltaproteobacteria bacterium]|nr:SCP2 sterol-binding domain-containing protein [Deltaproteobacteria bacterium]